MFAFGPENGGLVAKGLQSIAIKIDISAACVGPTPLQHSFIHGAEDDARDLSEHLAAHLDQTASPRSFKVAV
jgi:hypothetical protein